MLIPKERCYDLFSDRLIKYHIFEGKAGTLSLSYRQHRFHTLENAFFVHLAIF